MAWSAASYINYFLPHSSCHHRPSPRTLSLPLAREWGCLPGTLYQLALRLGLTARSLVLVCPPILGMFPPRPPSFMVLDVPSHHLRLLDVLSERADGSAAGRIVAAVRIFSPFPTVWTIVLTQPQAVDLFRCAHVFPEPYVSFLSPSLLQSSHVTASDDPDFVDEHEYRVNSFRGSIGPYDAKVLLSKPPWIFTSPNRSDIPFIELQPTDLRARADGRFGLEDYLLWPQNHSEAYPWAPCVLRRPPLADIGQHPYWFLWDSLTRNDWRFPLGSLWQHTGVLDRYYHDSLSRGMQPITQRALRASRHGALPSYVHVAVQSLQATLARLRDLPMSFRDMILQFTQAQRLGLDLLAMEVYHSEIFDRMIQRTKVHPLRTEFVGCYTNNLTTVENMHHAGIPVVYMRPSSRLAPSQLLVRAVTSDFAPPSPDIITADWPRTPCRSLHQGSSTTRRFQMSRPLGRYFEDLASLDDTPEPVPDMCPFMMPRIAGPVSQGETSSDDEGHLTPLSMTSVYDDSDLLLDDTVSHRSFTPARTESASPRTESPSPRTESASPRTEFASSRAESTPPSTASSLRRPMPRASKGRQRKAPVTPQTVQPNSRKGRKIGKCWQLHPHASS